jgi:ribonuclease BN (tRNA processing enzyme)
MHPDHFLDIVPLRYALRYGPRTNARRVALYLPPGGEDVLRRMTSAFAPESPADYLSEVYDLQTYDPAAVLHLGTMRVRFTPTAHFIPTFAIRCDVDGASVTYSADTAPEPRVATLAAHSDVFLCEATLSPGAKRPLERGHLTAREAGEMGRAAGARRLVLTHYGSETNHAELVAEARIAFEGEIVVADDHLRLDVG